MTVDKFDLDMCIRNIASKEEGALESLYERMSNPIYRFSLMILSDKCLAEDATQETFFKIFKCADKYRPDTNPKAWIFSIARNICVDIINKKQKVSSIDEHILELHDEERKIDNIVNSIVIKEAINKLSVVEKDILSLYLFAGLKQTEIADIVGISYKKVRSLYNYALKKIRKEIHK